jgi:hypothetical protein
VVIEKSMGNREVAQRKEVKIDEGLYSRTSRRRGTYHREQY